MDGLDEMMAALEAEKSSESLQKASSTQRPREGLSGQRSNVACVPCPRRLDVDSTAVVKCIVARLERLRLDIADPSTHEALHSVLAAKSPSDTLGYYLTHSELSRYTITAELSRMDYKIIPLEADIEVVSVADITALFESDVERRQHGEDRGPEVLWRMANQSLFADALEAVHRQLVVPHDEDGGLCLAARTEHAEFVVDFSLGELRATCNLALSTLSGHGAERLALATIVLAVQVIVTGDGRKCLKLSQVVRKISPGFVFDEQLEAAALALLEMGPGLSQPQDDGANGQDKPGFMGVRAANALGAATASAFGVAAGASASAIDVATKGLFRMNFSGSDAGNMGSAPCGAKSGDDAASLDATPVVAQDSRRDEQPKSDLNEKGAAATDARSPVLSPQTDSTGVVTADVGGEFDDLFDAIEKGDSSAEVKTTAISGLFDRLSS